MTRHPEEGTLHAYIDGELSPAETAALELHVGECARCSAALAEARGFVAAASRVITTLDAAPSSAVTPAAAVAGVPAAPSKRAVRPPVFRVPYARAAALLLLVGGTAFVFDRSGTFARGKSTQAESVMADAAAESDLAATAPVKAAATPTTAPIQARAPTPVGVTLSTGATESTGSARREPVAPRRTTAAATTGETARSAERSPPPSETAPADIAGRGVAGGVAIKAADPLVTEPSNLAGRDAAFELARPMSARPVPAPARMTTAAQERAAGNALDIVSPVARYRTRDGIIVTLTEEPLRTTFAEESLATGQAAPAPTRRGAAPQAAAQAAAPPINSYRWSSAERGRTYTLSGPLTVAELEGLSKRLSELERLP